MYLPITNSFIGIFVPLYILLSLKVVRTRRKNKIPLGDGNHPELIKLISTHGNFSQYIPLGIICMLVGELQGVHSSILIGSGIALLLGRISHAIGIVLSKPGPNKPRVIGMVLTFGPLFILALACAFQVK